MTNGGWAQRSLVDPMYCYRVVDNIQTVVLFTLPSTKEHYCFFWHCLKRLGLFVVENDKYYLTQFHKS